MKSNYVMAPGTGPAFNSVVYRRRGMPYSEGSHSTHLHARGKVTVNT